MRPVPAEAFPARGVELIDPPERPLKIASPRPWLGSLLLSAAQVPASAEEPSLSVELATPGHQNVGTLGLTVAVGPDVDGNGHVDYAFGSFQADPLGISADATTDIEALDGCREL